MDPIPYIEHSFLSIDRKIFVKYWTLPFFKNSTVETKLNEDICSVVHLDSLRSFVTLVVVVSIADGSFKRLIGLRWDPTPVRSYWHSLSSSESLYPHKFQIFIDQRTLPKSKNK